MLANIDPFQAIAISRLAHTLQAAGRSIIHMEFGQPSTGAPTQAITLAHQVLDSDPLGYWESTELKAALAQHYRDTYGVDVDPDRFILTCGASQALVLALVANFEPGQRVAIARPGYVAYRNSLKALHLMPVEIPCGPQSRFQLTAAALKQLDPAPDGVIVASPANPTGTIIAASELSRIAMVCRERKILVIADEIYHGLSYGEPARSMLEFDPGSFVINSFSKYFSMVGWRLGWLLAPPRHVQRARAFSGNLFLSAPSLSQHAARVALASRAELDSHLTVYRHNRDLLRKALPSWGLQNMAPPDGAFYLYVDVSRYTNNSLAFCETLLRDTGVATAPGVDFDPVEGHHFIRLCFAVSTAQTEEAIRRLHTWFTSR
jgi:aspartate/methionine/tyrosine aminotransferase